MQNLQKDNQKNIPIIIFGDKIVFESVTDEKRKEVFELLSQEKYYEALTLVNSIIKMNIEYILENTQEIIEEKNIKRKEDKEKEKEKEKEREEQQKKGTIKEKPLLHFAKLSLDDLYKKSIEKIISTHLYFEEYFSNILLAIHIYTKINSRDKIQRTLHFLKREMIINKFSEINQIIIQFMVQNENNIEKNSKNINLNILKDPINLFKSISIKNIKKILKVPQDLYKKCEDIYFNSLKIYISCAQYAINLREINLYEEYILEFVMKINLLLSKDNYIICNTFLLLANLYMRMGSIKKAHCLYEKIINKNQQGLPKDKNMCKVLIAANYNLGLISYITGKYDISKLRLENALEIKKTTVKNNYDVELIKIYETLAEVDVQYKNYSSAYLYIQEGMKLLINKGSPNPTPENMFNKEYSHRSNKHLNKCIKNSKEQFDDKESDESSSNEGYKKISFRQKLDNELNYNAIQNYTNEELILNKKFKILKNYIGSKLSETLLFTKYDNVDIQKNLVNSHNFGNVLNYIQMKNANLSRRKERTDDAEDNRLFKEFLDLDGNEPINDARNINERELSTFILFIASLSEKQLKKLNNDQPKDYEYNKKLPIIFTKDFKDSLTGIQRYNFCQLRLSSLTRVKVLSDYNKKISNKNMNYKGLYQTQNMSEIDKINLYVEGKGILGMWENEDDVEKEDIEDSDSEKDLKWKKEAQKDEEDIEEKSNIKSVTKEENKNKINYSFEQNEKYGFNEMMKLSKEIFMEGSDYINFDRFKEFVLDYFKNNYKEELGYINDEFIIMITKDLNKSKIKKILFNPKLLYDLLVIYTKSKGIEIERPKKRRRTKGDSREDKIIFLHAA
jgi:hypothetical protein